MEKTRYSLRRGLAFLTCLGVVGILCQTDSTAIPRPGTASGVRFDSFGKLPLYFIENRGQEDPRVAYYVQGRDTTLYLTSQGLTFVLSGSAQPSQDARVDKVRFSPRRAVAKGEGTGSMGRWVVKLDFVGANPEVKPEGREPMPAVISYFKGPRDKWRTGLKTYGSVIYRDLWPGIDLIYTGTVNRLKYSFLVKPGADPERIRLAYSGISSLSVSDGGQLEVKTPVRGFQDDRPVAYQEVEGRAVEVKTAYAVKTGADERARFYGFKVGEYDRSKLLVLDPAVFVYCGYIGGSGQDEGYGIAVDGSGNAYVTGSTSSTEATFPVTVGPDLTRNGGYYDAFVAKVNPSGTALVYCGYIGGMGDDSGTGIAVDGGGNAYVTGSTSSTEATFPVTVGPDLTHNGGSGTPHHHYDAFVAKVNPSGTALVYCGYIGGSDYDDGGDIAVDNGGNAYVTGSTESSEATFPVTVGPDLTYNGLYVDAFVAKVNPSGTALLYCGYIGGMGDDSGTGIAVDNGGNAYVTGYTESSEATFPVTVGPELTYNGGGDAFVAKVNAAGTGLVYCGYIGGSSKDSGTGIAVDNGGNAYVTGYTESTEATFPVTVGPDLTFNGGYDDAFVAKVNPSGTALLYCGYIGGSGSDEGLGIAVDGSGNAYVTGRTGSSEATFPVTVGPELTYNGGGDAFVAKVNPSGTALLYCGYIGGSGRDEGWGIAVDGGGNAYVTGYTDSTEATFPVTVGPDLTFNGGNYYDAFVAKVVVVAEDDTAAPSTPTNLVATAISSSQIDLTWAASTDNVGVSGYRIYRNGAQVATSPTNSYSDTGLSPATIYTYTVAAFDAAGNVSAQSASASATTSSGGGNGGGGGGGGGCFISTVQSH